MARILVLGGDGFCGWPTTLRLSALGHEVSIADNLVRRLIDEELGASSLTPIASLQTRLAAWQEVSGSTIGYFDLDVARDYAGLLKMLSDVRPQAIVHFAEQRAAPYSMKSSRHKRYTVENNLSATNNILCAIIDSGLDVHLVHLGTMGVYGYGSSGMKIPEGYLKVQIPLEAGGTVDREIL